MAASEISNNTKKDEKGMKLHLITVTMVLCGYLSVEMPEVDAAYLRPSKRDADDVEIGLDSVVMPTSPKNRNNVKQQQEPLAAKDKAEIAKAKVGKGNNNVVIWPASYGNVVTIEADSKQVQIKQDGGDVRVIWSEAEYDLTIKGVNAKDVRVLADVDGNTTVIWP